MATQPKEEKVVRNCLKQWRLEPVGDGFIIIGEVMTDQPTAGVKAGQLLRTSYIQRIYRIDNGETKVAETLNSLYYLAD